MTEVFFPFPVVRQVSWSARYSLAADISRKGLKDSANATTSQDTISTFHCIPKIKVSRKLSQIKGTVDMGFIVTDRCTQFCLLSKIFFSSQNKRFELSLEAQQYLRSTVHMT